MTRSRSTSTAMSPNTKPAREETSCRQSTTSNTTCYCSPSSLSTFSLLPFGKLIHLHYLVLFFFSRHLVANALERLIPRSIANCQCSLSLYVCISIPGSARKRLSRENDFCLFKQRKRKEIKEKRKPSSSAATTGHS